MVKYADYVNLALRETKWECAERVPHAPMDVCDCTDCRRSRVVTSIDLHFKSYHLSLNLTKTVLREMSTRVYNVGGSLLGISLAAKEKLKKHKSSAARAFNQLYNLWLRGLPVTVATKMQIYNTTVRPHFLQSAVGAALLRKVEGDKLDSLHRAVAQLRRLLRIHYPQHLSNQGVYERIGVAISLDTLGAHSTALTC